jgi:catechol 2,3-dioxygenase-like lactoylglutathione lyase family enzyme
MSVTNIQRIGQVAVPVLKIESAIHFYKELLGLPLLFNTDTMAFLDCNGVRLLLSLPEKEQFAHSSSVLYFQVEDIRNSYETYLEKGVVFIDEPHLVARVGQIETWMTFFKDPFNNVHALMSEVEAG